MKDPVELLDDLRVKLVALGEAYNAAITAYNKYADNLFEIMKKIKDDETKAAVDQATKDGMPEA